MEPQTLPKMASEASNVPQSLLLTPQRTPKASQRGPPKIDFEHFGFPGVTLSATLVSHRVPGPLVKTCFTSKNHLVSTRALGQQIFPQARHLSTIYIHEKSICFRASQPGAPQLVLSPAPRPLQPLHCDATCFKYFCIIIITTDIFTSRRAGKHFHFTTILNLEG